MKYEVQFRGVSRVSARDWDTAMKYVAKRLNAIIGRSKLPYIELVFEERMQSKEPLKRG